MHPIEERRTPLGTDTLEVDPRRLQNLPTVMLQLARLHTQRFGTKPYGFAMATATWDGMCDQARAAAVSLDAFFALDHGEVKIGGFSIMLHDAVKLGMIMSMSRREWDEVIIRGDALSFPALPEA